MFSSLHCSACRKLRSLEWRSSLSQETRAKMPWSPTWRWIFLLYWLLYINDILYKCNSISFMIMRMAFICLCVEGNTSLWFSWNQRNLTATGLQSVSTLTSQRRWTQSTRCGDVSFLKTKTLSVYLFLFFYVCHLHIRWKGSPRWWWWRRRANFSLMRGTSRLVVS